MCKEQNKIHVKEKMKVRTTKYIQYQAAYEQLNMLYFTNKHYERNINHIKL